MSNGCHAPEYISKVLKESQKQDVLIGEAESKDGVKCVCKNKKCEEKK